MKPLNKTRLSSSKEFVPTEDGTGAEEYLLIVYVDANGSFYAPMPPHLINSAGHLAEGDGGASKDHSYRKIRFTDGFVISSSKTQVLNDWATLIWWVKEYLTNLIKEKVIWLQTEMNIRYQRPDGSWVVRRDAHFNKTCPVVGISYQVCYKVGAKLLKEDNGYLADTSLREREGVIIPFSEERAQFLDTISEILHKAARQLSEFEEALQKDPLQIDNIMRQGFMLEYTAKSEDGAV